MMLSISLQQIYVVPVVVDSRQEMVMITMTVMAMKMAMKKILAQMRVMVRLIHMVMVVIGI